mgnify:CR=1 FL=1
MEITIRQNPMYIKGKVKPYYIYETSSLYSEFIGRRNKYGILALNPSRLIIDRGSFKDNQSLDDLTEFLSKKNVEFVID